jgi:FtsH-binding integral membrane protein
MNPSMRKTILVVILGIALMALSFVFFAKTDRPQTVPPAFSQRVYEWTATALVFTGFLAFAASSTFLSFTLRPTHALLFGLLLLAACVGLFLAAVPFASPHSWTFLFVLLPFPAGFFGTLAFTIGLLRWINRRRAATSY